MGAVGKKLTDLMATQEAKLRELEEALLAQDEKIAEQVEQQGTQITDKMTAQETKLAALDAEEAALTEKVGAQETKMTALQQEGTKIMETITGQEKKISEQIKEEGEKLKADMPDPKLNELESEEKNLVDRQTAQETTLKDVEEEAKN